MRVLIDALSARWGGGQTYLVNLLSRVPANVEVHVIADAGLDINALGARKTTPEWPVQNPFVRAAWQRLRLPHHAARLGASVLFYPGGIVGSRAPQGCKRVTMFRNVIPFDPAQRAKYPLLYPRAKLWLLERAMLRSMAEADLVIFLSDYARGLIESRLGSALARNATIPHGIGPEFRSAPPRRPDWLPDHPYLLYVSAFDYYKAQVEVVRAFAQVVSRWKGELSLVLLGAENNAYGRRAREEVARLELGGRVLMPGAKPYRELPAAYHHSLIGIFASEAENCPNSLLEAMAAGKPIVCSNRAPMPEFGSDAVQYFDPAQPEELAALLLRLLEDPQLRQGLGKAAAQRSLRYDWDVTARATWSAIARLVE